MALPHPVADVEKDVMASGLIVAVSGNRQHHNMPPQ